MHLLFSPSGVLHAVAEESLSKFVDEKVRPSGEDHGRALFNLQVLLEVPGVKGNTTEKKEAYGWRNADRLLSSPWLESSTTGEICYVYGKLDDFLGVLIPDVLTWDSNKRKNKVKELQRRLPSKDGEVYKDNTLGLPR